MCVYVCVYELIVSWGSICISRDGIQPGMTAWRRTFRDWERDSRVQEAEVLGKKAGKNWLTFHSSGEGLSSSQVYKWTDEGCKVRKAWEDFFFKISPCIIRSIQVSAVVVWEDEMQTRPVNNLWLWKANTKLGPCVMVFSVLSPSVDELSSVRCHC